jgi:hypothetical protein
MTIRHIRWLRRLCFSVALMVACIGPITAHGQIRTHGGSPISIGPTASGVLRSPGSVLGSVPAVSGSTVSAAPRLEVPSTANTVLPQVEVPSLSGTALPRVDMPTIPNTTASAAPDSALPRTDIPRVLGTAVPTLTQPAVAVPRVDTVTNTLSGSVRETIARPAAALPPDPVRAIRPRPATQRSMPTISRVPPAGEQRYIANEVLVGLPANLSAQAIAGLAQRYRLVRLESTRLASGATVFHRWQIRDRRSVSAVIRALEADAGVRVAQPNYRYTLQQRNGAAGAPMQYAPAAMKIPEAHGLATGRNVLVAVIDSGIDTAHPEIAHAIAGRFDAIQAQGPATGHGTAMAGAITARARLVGIAPTARILAIRAFAATADGYESSSFALIKSIDWATANNARVINMSFAGPRDPEMARSIAAAAKKGIVMVAAAGNAGPHAAPLYPASDPHTIAVTATDARDHLLPAASHGKHVALAAPGAEIIGPAPNRSYQVSSGTSVAAAHVSGVIALLLERQPSLTPKQVRKILQSTARDLGPKGHDRLFGAGLANAYRALTSLRPPPMSLLPAATLSAAR